MMSGRVRSSSGEKVLPSKNFTAGRVVQLVSNEINGESATHCGYCCRAVGLVFCLERFPCQRLIHGLEGIVNVFGYVVRNKKGDCLHKTGILDANCYTVKGQSVTVFSLFRVEQNCYAVRASGGD